MHKLTSVFLIAVLIGTIGDIAKGQQVQPLLAKVNRNVSVTASSDAPESSTRSASPTASLPEPPLAVAHLTVASQASFIVKIEAGNIVTGRQFGHGICLDFPCVHVLTNYHVAGLLHHAKVEGMSIKAAQYATGPDDPQAVPVKALGSVYNFNPQKDMALLTLKRPLPAKFTAARFALERPHSGMDVVRYPATVERYRGTLTHNGALRYLDANSQPHEMESALLTDFDSPLGISGGALCDAEGRVIGLSELHNSSIAIPLPVVSTFLESVDPVLWNRLGLQKVATHTTEIDGEIPTVIVGMSDDPEAAVGALVSRAAEMREHMTRVVAHSEIRRSGPGIKAKPEHYEVALFGSGIRFRLILPGGQVGAEMADVPLPAYGITPSADWDYLLAGLSAASITYRGETLYNDEIAHAFQFSGMLCPFREKRPTGLWAGKLVCDGEVLTDTTFHPLLIKAEFHFEPASILSRLQMEVQFKLSDLPNGQSFYLPGFVEIKAKYKRSFGTYNASNSFADYRLFLADHTIHTDVAAAGPTE